MKREFLEAMGLDKENVDRIMAENGADIEREKAKTATVKEDLEKAQTALSDREKDLESLKKTAGDAESTKKQLEELQDKYTKETEAHKAEIAERDYDAAVSSHVADLKFSSKGAKAAFVADLKAKKLVIKDGKLDGFDKYLEEAKKDDPEAFAPDKPTPQFGRPAGGVGEKPKTAGEQLAEVIGKSSAAKAKASSDIISMYTGGN